MTPTAIQLLSDLNSGKVSASEALELHLARYEAENPKLNAVIETDLDYARAIAKELDEMKAKGESAGPLHGLPMTVKDTYDVDGMPAIAGAPIFVGRDKNCEDAELVKRLKAAGAVIWGKTNTPLFAGDVQTYNKVYGQTNNPHDLSRTPGGSSGGAAAALASGITALEIGSDIGGSLRTPAHYCGVCALKPTYGLVPMKGHVPPPPDMDVPDVDLGVAGPMARNMDDLILLMSVLEPSYDKGENTPEIQNLKVAFWHKDPHFITSKACSDAVKKAVAAFSDNGAKTEETWMPFTSQALMETYVRLLVPIVTADLPPAQKRAMKLIKPWAKLIAKRGTMTAMNSALAATQSPEKAAEIEAARAELKAQCDNFFEAYDVLITPVTPTPAIAHNNEKSFYNRKIDVDGKSYGYGELFGWISLATACHLPSVSMPVLKTAQGLPVGVQIIGKEGADAKVLQVAKFLEGFL